MKHEKGFDGEGKWSRMIENVEAVEMVAMDGILRR